MIAIISNPVNSTVPIAAEIFKKVTVVRFFFPGSYTVPVSDKNHVALVYRTGYRYLAELVAAPLPIPVYCFESPSEP
jgi:hypothetical protein